MKVVYLSGTNSRNAGGVFVTVLETGKKLIFDYNVDVNFLMHNDEYSVKDSKLYPKGTLKSYTVTGPSNLGFSFDLRRQLSLLSPDVIHTQSLWMYLSYQAASYKKINKVPVIVSPHGMLDPYQLNTSLWKKKIALALYEKENLRTASVIHALNEREYSIIRSLGFKNPVAIIPNGVNLPAPNYTPVKPVWKSNDRKVLLFLSRIDPKKNIHTLLSAWRKSNYSISNWDLIIAGDLKNKDYAELLLKIADDCPSIKFIGGQFGEDKDSTFYHSDAFILPSFSEGLPMAVLEAWSYKKFTMISESCNLSDAFTLNASKKIMTDEDSLIKSMNELFTISESNTNYIASNAYNLVKSQYTWDSVAFKMNHLYKWVMGQSSKPDFVYIT